MKLELKKTQRIFYRILPAIALCAFLLVGIMVYDDYGVAWDEQMQMKYKGEPAYNFIVTGDEQTYLNHFDKYQGPAFELFLFSFQKIFHLSDSREIYLFRHLVCFVFFWFSGLIFYFLLKKKYTDPFIIFIGVVWYFLMPRIFADSFYNSKDIPFLGMTTVCIWSMINFLQKPSWKWGILHGLVCGFLIDIRLMGVLLPAVTMFVIFVRIIFSIEKLKTLFSFLLPCGIFLLSGIIFIIAFWPVLWLNPVYHFIQGWKEMSNFSWISNALYQGKYILHNELPWHYDIVWILITTPIQYIFFFLIGIFFIGVNIFSFKKEKILLAELEYISMLILFIPIITIIILHSVEYDAWRHVFFLYVPLCIIATTGLHYVKTKLTGYLKPVWINSTILLFTLPIAYKMIEMHPYQNIYFNGMIGPDAGSARFKYELDYWGLAYREALEKLYDTTKDSIISVYVANLPGVLNAGILPVNVRDRFQFEKFLDNANYFITDYRWEKKEFEKEYKALELKKIDSIEIDGGVISSTFILRPEKRQLIYLQSVNGKFVCADGAHNNVVVADRDVVYSWETFLLIFFEESKCAIRSYADNFFTVELNNQNKISSAENKISINEIFTLTKLENNYVAFKAINGKYISVDKKTLQLFANSDSIQEEEKFKLFPAEIDYRKHRE